MDHTTFLPRFSNFKSVFKRIFKTGNTNTSIPTYLKIIGLLICAAYVSSLAERQATEMAEKAFYRKNNPNLELIQRLNQSFGYQSATEAQLTGLFKLYTTETKPLPNAQAGELWYEAEQKIIFFTPSDANKPYPIFFIRPNNSEQGKTKEPKVKANWKCLGLGWPAIQKLTDLLLQEGPNLPKKAVQKIKLKKPNPYELIY